MAKAGGATRAAHAADLLFVGIAVASSVAAFRRYDGYAFASDDWKLFRWEAGDVLLPWNGHLSVVPITVYRVVLEAFGLGSTGPARIVELVSWVALAVAVYVVVRARTAPPLALIAGSMILWFPEQTMVPPLLNFWTALAAIVVASALLSRPGRRSTVAVAGLVGLALLSSSVGVAGAVGCLVFVLLRRGPASRVAAVAVPLAGWLTWYVTIGRSHSDSTSFELDTLTDAFDGVVATFRAIAFGNAGLGAGLMVLFVVRLGLVARHGLAPAAPMLAWTAALGFWWVGLAAAKALLETASVSRYQMVGAVFVLLAVLPEQRPEWARRLAEPVPLAFASLGAVCVVALVIVANAGAIRDRGDLAARQGRERTQVMVVAGLPADVMPDGTVLPLVRSGGFTAGEFRRLIREHGVPEEARTSQPDRRVVELGRLRTSPVPRSAGSGCRPVEDVVAATAGSTTVITADDDPVSVSVRRFGRSWVPVGTVGRGRSGRLDLPGLSVTTPWQIRAPRGCSVELAPVRIVRPKRATELSGRTYLVAATQEGVEVDSVAFVLRGRDGERSIGEARKGLGWALTWDSTTVPNGRYELVAVTTDAGGRTLRSRPRELRVRN